MDIRQNVLDLVSSRRHNLPPLLFLAYRHRQVVGFLLSIVLLTCYIHLVFGH